MVLFLSQSARLPPLPLTDKWIPPPIVRNMVCVFHLLCVPCLAWVTALDTLA